MNPKADIPSLIEQIRASKKYQGMQIPEETLRDLLEQELERHNKPAEALKSARSKLHNVMASYLGDLDYSTAGGELQAAFDSGEADAVRSLCESFLRQHDSTRERLPYLQELYQGIFSICGQPEVVMDLACGLNPFSLPWMGLPIKTQFHAYDILPARIDLINDFLKLIGREGQAEVRDILVRPPQIKADAAFLFKEAHRMEKRQKGCNHALWAALKVNYLFVSLPNRSLDGRRDLRERMRRLVETSINGQDWEHGELEFPGETIYWIRKGR